MRPKLTKNLAVKFWAILGVVLATALPVSVLALTTISQGYMTTESLAVSSIVSLQKDTTDHVEASTTANVDSLLGVIINDGNSLLSLSNGAESQVQVATSGVVQALVSDINGSVGQGDQITASPISGVGMKATDSIKVVGIAQSDLKDENSAEQTYKDKSGKENKVRVGQIPIQVNVAYFYKQPIKTLIPTAIQNIANALAGKPVNTLPIIISSAIFIVMLIIVVSIIFSMIRSSIISVGRNPMSQSAVYRNVIQLSALVVGVLAVGVVSIYLVLTKI